MEKNFESMKKAVAQQIAYEKHIQKKVETSRKNIDKLTKIARNYVENEKDDEAKNYLIDKKREEEYLVQYESLLVNTKLDTKSFRERLIAMQKQLDTLKSKRDYLVTRYQFVKNNLALEKRMNGSNYEISLDSLQKEIDEIEALTNINRELDREQRTISTETSEFEVEDELQKIKDSVKKAVPVK